MLVLSWFSQKVGFKEKCLLDVSPTEKTQPDLQSDFSLSKVSTTPYQKGSPDLSKISVTSPVILSSSPESSHVNESDVSHPLCSPNDSKTSFTSPIVLSGSEMESHSLFSTPRNIEFDTSMFFSQYQVNEHTGVVRQPEVQCLRFETSPPTFLDCQKYIQQPLEDPNASAIQPHYGSLKDVPDAIRIGAKHINLKHVDALPEQIFYPECENDLGILGLESWEEVIDAKHERSDLSLVSMKYSFKPPRLSDARTWLMKKKKTKNPSSESQIMTSSATKQSKITGLVTEIFERSGEPF